MFDFHHWSVPWNRTKKSSVSRSGPRKLLAEKLEDRALLNAAPLGALPRDTGEFLLGKVAVTPVFFESNGEIDPETQDWTAEEIDAVLTKVSEGVGWWSDLLDSLDSIHTLDFVIDDTFAQSPVATPYEPIDRPSGDFTKYVGGFLIDQGFGDSGSLEGAVHDFNHSQRVKLGTDWAFTIFFADSSDDADGLFASGGTFAGAFAYAGGLFVVMPATRPSSTIAHEMGHIFWARDEYPGASSWTDRRGYYDTQNLNAADNPAWQPSNPQPISIMRGGVPLTQAYESLVSPESTLAMVGWQDSDGNGIFDVADVPLSLDGVGYFDLTSSIYHFAGQASAVPLINRNSSGNQSDITLNRVSEIQYRLDGGDWMNASSPDSQSLVFDLQVTITDPFNTIEWRAVDIATGVVSPSLLGTDHLPGVLKTGVTGLTFLDVGIDGNYDSGDPVLGSTEVLLTKADGALLPYDRINANDLPNGPVSTNNPNTHFVALSEFSNDEVTIESSFSIPDSKTFHHYDPFFGIWSERWNKDFALEVSLPEVVGTARVLVHSGQGDSFARLEAYNANGEIIDRVTSKQINAHESARLEISSRNGDISSLVVYGHAGTDIIVEEIEFGITSKLHTDNNGLWNIPFLPSGQYRAEYQSDRVIYSFPASGQMIEVDHDQHQVHAVGATRVDSIFHNALVAEDVNEDGGVSAVDALLVLNDLGRNSGRVLGWDDATEFKIDVTNDGEVSALDALIVINSLARGSVASAELVYQESTFGKDLTYFGSLQEESITVCHPSAELSFGGPDSESEDFNRQGESIDELDADIHHTEPYGPIAFWPDLIGASRLRKEKLGELITFSSHLISNQRDVHSSPLTNSWETFIN